MKKRFIIEIDFDNDTCPYGKDYGCDHPKMLKYNCCTGNDQPHNCPLEEVVKREPYWDHKF